MRSVLSVRPFRRLYGALALSSVGDWLGLLAMTALAANLAGGTGAAANYALGGVLVLRLLPALLIGPVAGVFADRFDRGRTMVVCDTLRFALYLSIPFAERLVWVLAVTLLVEVVTLFWMPAKEAVVPNLLTAGQLPAANQLSLATTYGLAPVAASMLFASLAYVSELLAGSISFFEAKPVDLAILLNAATFAVSATVVARTPEIGGRASAARAGAAMPEVGQPRTGPSLLAAAAEGWSYLAHTPFVRGLVMGILGAFAAAGVLIGVSRQYAVELGGGDAAYGLLFGSVFVGLGIGVAIGPFLSRQFPGRRVFGLSLVWSGVMLAVAATVSTVGAALFVVVLIGLGAGVAFLVGLTILGRDVDDRVRGRTFAFVFSMTRVVLIATLAAVPFLVGSLTGYVLRIGPFAWTLDGARTVAFIAGLTCAGIAVMAIRTMGSGALPGGYAHD